MAIANVELRALLSDGDTAHKPYRSKMLAQTYTKGTAVTIQDVTSTDETLSVDTAKVVPFYVDDIDRIQNKWDAATTFATDAMEKLNEIVDADILSQYSVATSTVKDSDVGGSSAIPVPLSVANISRVFTSAARKLKNLNVKLDNRFAVISPIMLEVLQLYISAKDTSFGDEVGANGFVGTRFGFDIYVSTNLTWAATIGIATTPTDADTVTYNGITFTFKTTLGSTAGNVLIGGSAANSNTNLATLLNTPGTTTSNGVALSVDNQAKLLGMTATAAATSVAIVHKGAGEIVVSTSLTASADGWNSNTRILHALFGRKGATDLVMQQTPMVEFKEVPDKLGKNVLPWMLYGKKTFTDGKDALVDVQVDASSF